MSHSSPTRIIGAGLAGCEAALQIADRGHPVELFEMRPQISTPAHTTGLFAELVCSNSLKGRSVTVAHGLLKEELRLLDSRLLQIACEQAVPAGDSLAVDRLAFSQAVTDRILSHPQIRVIREEVKEIDPSVSAILCAGPLVSRPLSDWLSQKLGKKHLFFFDAVAPTVQTDSLDFSIVFAASRYGKGEPDFLNCPLEKEEYKAFWEALTSAKQHPLHDFEEGHFFEGCLPVEEIARRGEKSLAFGPMRPVGLSVPQTGKRPYAVVQLRKENRQGTLCNLVGFQTRLTQSEQERVFRMIPGLERAEFVRYGKMHQNTFLCAPLVFEPGLRLKSMPKVWVAGQLSGCEGYCEAIATGLICGLLAQAPNTLPPPPESAIGSLLEHLIRSEASDFQPMNFNFGLLPPLPDPPKSKKEKRQQMAQRALDALSAWKNRKFF